MNLNNDTNEIPDISNQILKLNDKNNINTLNNNNHDTNDKHHRASKTIPYDESFMFLISFIFQIH
jgi:hypothetical protein